MLMKISNFEICQTRNKNKPSKTNQSSPAALVTEKMVPEEDNHICDLLFLFYLRS